jgi:hypothetical protein
MRVSRSVIPYMHVHMLQQLTDKVGGSLYWTPGTMSMLTRVCQNPTPPRVDHHCRYKSDDASFRLQITVFSRFDSLFATEYLLTLRNKRNGSTEDEYHMNSPLQTIYILIRYGDLWWRTPAYNQPQFAYSRPFSSLWLIKFPELVTCSTTFIIIYVQYIYYGRSNYWYY